MFQFANKTRFHFLFHSPPRTRPPWSLKLSWFCVLLLTLNIHSHRECAVQCRAWLECIWPTDKELQFCENAFVSFAYHNFVPCMGDKYHQEQRRRRVSRPQNHQPPGREWATTTHDDDDDDSTIVVTAWMWCITKCNLCIRNITHILIFADISCTRVHGGVESTG